MSNTLSSIPIFAPTQITNCALWLDAADTTTITLTGGNLTRWNDKSGLNNFATNTGTVFYTRGLNGLNVATFSNATATDNFMVTQTFSIDPILETYFYLVQFGATIGSYGISLASSHPTGNSFYIYLNKGASTLSLVVDQINTGTIFTSSSFDNTTTGPINQTCLISFQRTGTTTGELRYNGTLLTTTNSGLSGGFHQPTGYRVGANLTIGSIGEHIIYNASISTAQRQQVEGYLAWKWGIQSSLPSNHPYRNSPIYPTISLPVQFRSNLASIPMAPSSSPFSFFNPVSIPTCSLWLDAADTTTITSSGGSISQWRDKSSSALVLAQASSPNQPTLGPLLNNLQTIQFTTTQTLASTANLLTNPAQSWFTVFNSYNNANTNRFWLNHSSNIGVTGGEYFYGGNGTLWANIKSGNLSAQRAIIDNVGIGVTPFNSGQWYNTNIVDSNTTTDITSFSFRIDGTSRSISISGTNSNILTGTANINVFINNAVAANLYLSEIIFYNTALSIPQVQQVEGYLAWKWGLVASLPSNHPFKNNPPGLAIPVVPPRLTMNTRVFSPLSFSGNVLWLDANDTATMIFSGTNLTRWNDKSPLAMFASPSNSNVFLSNTGSYTGMYINNNNNTNAPGTTLLSLNSNFMTTSNYSIFVTIQLTSSSPSSLYQTIFSDNRATSEARIQIGDTQSFDFLADGSTIRAVNVSLGTSRQQICVTTSSNGFFFYQNGSLIASNTTTGSVFTTDAGSLPTIGGPSLSPPDNRFMTGWIFEMVIYSSVLSVQQRQSMEGYLAWKWGLQGSLPATHPYRLFPPPP